jgi:serine/threonine protein kinase
VKYTPFVFIQPTTDSGKLLQDQVRYDLSTKPKVYRSAPDKLQDEEPLVAVKELFSSDETDFLRERTILCALGPKNHPHLIKLLATYKTNKKYHLMFPYANANLRNYWEDHPTPKFDNETVYWSIKQMAGIASALQLIHSFRFTIPLSVPGAGDADVRYLQRGGIAQLSPQKGEEWFGRHGNIKAEQVLWFDQDKMIHIYGSNHGPMGVLQIADLGLGRFYGRNFPSGWNQENALLAPTYEPPEYSLRLPLSQAYDIWSLGCLYLEFITWLLKGSAAIDDFSSYRGRYNTDTGINDDNFFTIVTEDGFLKAHIREEVMAWSGELHSHKNCSALIHDILDLIMSELLIIEADHRSKASWLYVQLEKILKIAETDTEYLLKPVPRQPPSGSSNPKPLLEPPKRNAKRDSVTFLDQEHPKSSNTQFKVPSMENPPDLVLRNLGTPNFKPKHVGRTPTRPLPPRETHPRPSTERAQPPGL